MFGDRTQSKLNKNTMDKSTTKKTTDQIQNEKSFENSQKKAIKKARKKYMSVNIALNLYRENPNSSLIKSYQNSFYCAKTLTPSADGTKLVTKYCKNRWCPLCQSIRTAVLIKGYKPQLEQFPDAHFVTLTRPVVKEEELKAQQEKMFNTWTKIRKSKIFSKNNWSGILKRECTIRPNGYYHYHFHLIVSCKECAEYIVKRWLKLNTDCNPKAQCIEKIKDDGSLLELFKYFTKLISKNEKNGERGINYTRLDVIMRFMRGQRVFQPFGQLNAVNEEIDAYTPIFADMDQKRLNAFWNWQISGTDWVNRDTGECLTNYKPNKELMYLLIPDNKRIKK